MSKRRKPATRRRRKTTGPTKPYRATPAELNKELGAWTTQQALEYQEHRHRLNAGEAHLTSKRINASAARARYRKRVHTPNTNRRRR